MMKSERISKKRVVVTALSICFLFGLWIFVAVNYPDMIPSPKETWSRFLLTFSKPIKKMNLLQHVAASLRRVGIALLLSWAAGVSFGVVIGWNRTADALFGSVFTMLRPIPPLAWIPLITICFGISEMPKILIVFIGGFIPVVVNTQAGMQNMEGLYLEVARSFCANRRQLLWEVAMPSIMPAILAGMRTSTSSAWMVVVAAEMLGASSGVGFLISRGMDSADTPLVLVAMIAIGIVGALLAIVFDLVERKACPWMEKR